MHECSTRRDRAILRRPGWVDLDNPYSISNFCPAIFDGHSSKHELKCEWQVKNGFQIEVNNETRFWTLN